MSKKSLLIGGLILCVFVFLLLLNLISSSRISEDKFVEVYVQLSIAQEMFAQDTLKLQEEKRKIFQEAKVTPDEMNKFVEKLNQRPEKWSRIWKRIVEALEQKRQDLKEP